MHGPRHRTARTDTWRRRRRSTCTPAAAVPHLHHLLPWRPEPAAMSAHWQARRGVRRGADRRRPRSGTRTRSSTSCTSRPSTTRTATASATSAGLTEKLDYIARPGRDRDLAAAVLSRPRCATTATTSPTTTTSTPTTARCATSRASCARPIARGLRVITELVINHTSDQHPWFQEARARSRGRPEARLLRLERHGPALRRTRGSSSPTPRSTTGPGTRSAQQYYWHRFFSHQPDLNYDNPQVLQAVLRVMRLLARHGRRRPAARRHPLPLRARGHQLREPAGDARVPEAAARGASTSATPAACCSPRPTSGPRTCARTSATATSATWRSTSR